jgi:hypothetical protein
MFPDDSGDDEPVASGGGMTAGGRFGASISVDAAVASRVSPESLDPQPIMRASPDLSGAPSDTEKGSGRERNRFAIGRVMDSEMKIHA